MKQFLSTLILLVLCGILAGPASAAGQNSPPAAPKMQQLGILLKKRQSFDIDFNARTSVLAGQGAVRLESGAASGDDVTFNVIFTKIFDTVFANCQGYLAPPSPAGTRVVLWADGYSRVTAPDKEGRHVTITLGNFTECRLAADGETALGNPPPPLDHGGDMPEPPSVEDRLPKVIAAQPADPTLKELGIALRRKQSFTVDDATRTAQLVGTGRAVLENGPVSGGDAVLTVTFTKLKNGDFAMCAQKMDAPLEEEQQLIVWGYGHSETRQQDGKTSVALTLGPVTACQWAPITEPGPGQPPPHPPGGVAGVDFPEAPSLADNEPISRQLYLNHFSDAPAVDRLYEGNVMTGQDYRRLQEALPGPDAIPDDATPWFTVTLVPDMAKAVHNISADEKLTEDQKKVALHALARGGLAAKDFDVLATLGHTESFLHDLPPGDEAKLRFLINDPIIREQDRKAKIDGFLASAAERDERNRQLRRNSMLLNASVVVFPVLPFAAAAFAFRRTRRRWKEITAAALAVATAVWLLARHSPYCGLNLDSKEVFWMDYCMKDIVFIKHEGTYPGCYPGEGDMDHPYCFR